MYYLSKEDLEILWTQSWILSKGYDKETEKSESRYREDSFNIYLKENLKEKEVTMDNKRFVILGDVVESTIQESELDTKEINKEEEKDESN